MSHTVLPGRDHNFIWNGASDELYYGAYGFDSGLVEGCILGYGCPEK